MGFQLFRGDHLNERFSEKELRPNAQKRELIRCWQEPYTDKNGKEKMRKVSLMRPCEVAQFRTLFLTGALNLYSNWRLFHRAPPSGGGWANERNVTARILHILESENADYDAWERDKERERTKR